MVNAVFAAWSKYVAILLDKFFLSILQSPSVGCLFHCWSDGIFYYKRTDLYAKCTFDASLRLDYVSISAVVICNLYIEAGIVSAW